MAKLQAAAVKPLLGDKTVARPRPTGPRCWPSLAPYEAWIGRQGGRDRSRSSGLQRVREILAGKAKETITALIAKDKALEPEVSAIAAVDKLVRYHRDLYKLCNNFVSFRDFYGRKDKAIFQAGTLYLDQRSCDLCLTGRGRRQARRHGRAGRHLPRLLRLRAQRHGREDADRRRLHRRRLGQPDGRAATASSTTARAATGTPPSPRSSTTRSASGRRSGRRTRSWCG